MSPNHPEYADLKTGARLVTERYFRVSHRSLEKWPLAIRLLNGRRHVKTSDLFARAEAMIADAPSTMSNSALHHSRRMPRLVVADGSK
jgi:hypothetical protein